MCWICFISREEDLNGKCFNQEMEVIGMLSAAIFVFVIQY